MMNTSQLQCCIDCDPILRDNVIGVYAADRLPRSDCHYPCGLIVNTDIHSKPGKHWCAFYLETSGKVDFFDSYGFDTGYYNQSWKYWVRNRSVTYNNIRIQSDYSDVCGLYCLYFLRQRLLGQTMDDIVNRFDEENHSLNDYYVYDRMTRVYSMCVENVNEYNQRCTPLINM